jgi:hypothetical protein
LRLLLLEEAYGRTSLALPDTFLINHEDYTLRVGKFANRYSKVMLRSEHMSRFITAETRPWTTPQRFRFFRQYVDHIDNNHPLLQPNHSSIISVSFVGRSSTRSLSRLVFPNERYLKNRLSTHRKSFIATGNRRTTTPESRWRR